MHNPSQTKKEIMEKFVGEFVTIWGKRYEVIGVFWRDRRKVVVCPVGGGVCLQIHRGVVVRLVSKERRRRVLEGWLDRHLHRMSGR